MVVEPRNNLPLQRTSFVGREQEVEEVKRLLVTTQLLTLTGAGGCGKTRLAVQVARQVAGEYPDGTWFVELAALVDPTHVVHAVAAGLGLREVPGHALTEGLIEFVLGKTILLVELTREKCHPARGMCITSNVTLGSSRMSEPRGKSEVNDEFPRQTRVAGPGRAALSSRQARASARPSWMSSSRSPAMTASTRSALLLGPIRPPAPIRRPRAAHYGREVQEALSSAWSAANGICAKRLVPFLPELDPNARAPRPPEPHRRGP